MRGPRERDALYLLTLLIGAALLTTVLVLELFFTMVTSCSGSSSSLGGGPTCLTFTVVWQLSGVLAVALVLVVVGAGGLLYPRLRRLRAARLNVRG